MENKKNEQAQPEPEQYEGVMVGLLICQHGAPSIAMNAGNATTVMGVQQALVVWNQLGDILETLEAIEMGEMDEVSGEVKPCKMH